MDAKILIAAGIVGVVLTLLSAAIIANCWAQLKATGIYIPPQELYELCRLILIPSVSILTLGGIAEWRGRKK